MGSQNQKARVAIPSDYYKIFLRKVGDTWYSISFILEHINAKMGRNGRMSAQSPKTRSPQLRQSNNIPKAPSIQALTAAYLSKVKMAPTGILEPEYPTWKAAVVDRQTRPWPSLLLAATLGLTACEEIKGGLDRANQSLQEALGEDDGGSAKPEFDEAEEAIEPSAEALYEMAERTIRRAREATDMRYDREFIPHVPE